MNACDPGRVGVWINDPSNLNRLPKIAALWDGMFTDAFLPMSATVAHMAMVRAQRRPDGLTMKPHLWAVPGKGEPAGVFAQRVSDRISVLSPGVVDLNAEEDPSTGRVGDAYAVYLRDLVSALRHTVTWKDPSGATHIGRSTFIFRLNIAPNKAGFLPVDLLQTDSALYTAEQNYYGDMSRVSEARVRDNLRAAGVPDAKAQLCYGAAGPVKLDATRGITLPDVLYQGKFSGTKLPGGIVFTDDLMADAGLLA